MNYQTLVDDHRGLLQFGRKLGLAGGTMQFSLLIFANAWKHLELPFYKVGAPLLFAWCLYQFAKDFFILYYASLKSIEETKSLEAKAVRR